MSEPQAPETHTDTPARSGGADDRATTFQAVQGPQAEHYSGEVLLVSAYAVLWAILLAWVALVWRKQSRIMARVDDLERVIDAEAARSEHGAGR